MDSENSVDETQVSTKKYAEMLSNTWDSNWNPDGNHCIVYPEDNTYKHCGKRSSPAFFKGECGKRSSPAFSEDGKCIENGYICSECENTLEGKNVRKMIDNLQEGDLEMYRDRVMKARINYARSKLRSDVKIFARLPMEKENSKVDVKCTTYRHNRRYIRSVDNGLILEKSIDASQKVTFITIGIDDEDNGNIRLITMDDLKVLPTLVNIWYDEKSIDSEALKYLNRNFADMKVQK